MKREFICKWSNWWILNPNRQQLNDSFIKELNELIEREVSMRTKHENGNDTNRLLSDVDFNSPENQNRDKAIIGYGPVLKCKCEMPAKMHGKNLCWRCKRALS